MRLSDQICLQIKDLILELSLTIGDKLPSERRLAEQFNVSRPAVREAIHSLTGQGLLVTKRGGGSYIQADITQDHDFSLSTLNQFISLDPSYQYDVLEARHAIEQNTAWHAALRATPQDKEKIQHCFDVMQDYQAKGNSHQAAVADAEFHLAIAEASHNIVFVQIMRGLFNVLLTNVEKNRRTIFNNPDSATHNALNQQHQQLLQSILSGDAEQAKIAATHHLDYLSSAAHRWDEDQARQQRAVRLSR